MRDAYADLCMRLQALRRTVEGHRTPLAPAMGVGGSVYTHQLANVHRVLTDVRVRHLLADEVGLGKTVQALMVLNALRCQRPDLKALVIVPDHLVTQWRDELLTRGHTAPLGEDTAPDGEEPEGGQYIRLVWEDQLKPRGDGPRFALSDIDPARFDVLVVDEFQRLRADLQGRVVQTSAGFEHLLVLTATPDFKLPTRNAQLFALIEPERAALARSKLAHSPRGVAAQLNPDDLTGLPLWAAEGVIHHLLALEQAAATPNVLGSLPLSDVCSALALGPWQHHTPAPGR